MPDVAALIAVPLPFNNPVTVVDNVNAGVAPPDDVPAKVTTPVDAVEGVSPLNDVWNDVTPPELVADNVPAENDNPVPTVTLLKPPEPSPYKIDVPLVAGALLLNVVQSADVKRPRFEPDADGRLNVWVSVALEILKSEPDVPVAKY